MAETNDSAGDDAGAPPSPPAQPAPLGGDAPTSSGPLEINLTSNPQLDDPAQFAQATDGSSAAPPPAADVGFQERPYNPDESRDWTRQTIALWLIGLVCSIVGLTFVAIFAHGAASGFANPNFFSELKQVLDVIAGPIITLLASAIGYYFGSKQGDNGQAKTSSTGSSGQAGTTGSGGK